MADKSWHLDRRTFVMGTGVSLGLPWLECMARGSEAPRPRRMCAMYFGFAMLNWMSRRSLIGGIYNRPIAIANMTHFLMVGIALSKLMLAQADLPKIFWLITGIYVIYAVIFGWLLFRTPPLGKSS